MSQNSGSNWSECNNEEDMEVEDPFKDVIQKMEMSCVGNDPDYLEQDALDFLELFDVNNLNSEQLNKLKNVSLEAAMEGYVKCLEVLVRLNIPLHELCPIIAAYNGQQNVIEFCAMLNMDCCEAWKKYFIWVVKKQCVGSIPEHTQMLMCASKWVELYHRVNGSDDAMIFV